MTNEWYKDPKKIMELAEFLVETEELDTAKLLLDYFKNPERYTDVWILYQKEIQGDTSSTGGHKDKWSSDSNLLPIFLALAPGTPS